MPAQKKTYRLDEETLDILEKYAKEKQINQTEAIKEAIHKLYKSPAKVQSNAILVETLQNQIKEKDLQIERLLTVADQAQKLNLVTVEPKQLEESATEKRSWWSRLRG